MWTAIRDFFCCVADFFEAIRYGNPERGEVERETLDEVNGTWR